MDLSLSATHLSGEQTVKSVRKASNFSNVCSSQDYIILTLAYTWP